MPASRVERSVILPESRSPAQLAAFQSPLAVIATHPWGPLGGNMDNNVVFGIVHWFQRLKVTTLRFDFCGTQIGRGHQQVDQLREAARFLLEGQFSSTSSKPPNRILVVGYSYGSIIGLSASASIPECIGVAAIAPPLSVRHWLYLFNGNYHLQQARERSNLPKLMVIGSRDNFTSESVFHDIVKTMPQNSTTGAVLNDADHFFFGREKELMKIVGQWILNIYPECIGDLKSLGKAEFPMCETPLESTSDLGAAYNCHEC